MFVVIVWKVSIVFMKNFWEKLKQQKKPFFCLAPMAEVTDMVFRQMVIKFGKPDVVFTEMVACDGLCSLGKERLLEILKFSEKERPIVAQVFGACPENFYQTALLVKQLGFDGIDINMGCPQKNILKQGAGADLINHPALAKKIIQATKAGAGELPVSVKTRIGFNQDEIEVWLPILLAEQPAVITLHGRTKKALSKISADWGIIKRGVEIAKGSGVLIVGNGDVQDILDGRQKAQDSGVDGVMIGRAVLKRPWLFNNLDVGRPSEGFPSKKERLKMLEEHLKLFEKIYQRKGEKNFALMKKHIKNYLVDFKGAKELRLKLMECEEVKEVEKILQPLL